MIILAFETSCDETAAAILQKGKYEPFVRIKSTNVASSLPLHAKTGGIIPEVAARKQIEYILPIVEKTIKDANIAIVDIDAIAVTIGPGLIGSLLVGVETAKTLSYIWDKPLIPVNHLFGHIYANFIQQDSSLAFIEFPAIGLVVSGGHTDIVVMYNHKKIQWLGGTRDDAAGEAFDKIGRLLGMPYPAGPLIEKQAEKGDPKAIIFPRPLISSPDFDFSFSGLKTAALRTIEREKSLSQKQIADISYAVQQAIVDVITAKTLRAAEKYNAKSILIGGGVAANKALCVNFKKAASKKGFQKVFVPHKNLCTDNAAMIGAAAFFQYQKHSWEDIQAKPELYFQL